MMVLPNAPVTLRDLFVSRCRREPNRLAYAFLVDSLESAGQYTFGELEARVGRIARGLSRCVHSGDRILLLFPPGLEVVPAFWACVLAGAVPVPAPAADPLRLKNSLPRLRAIIDDAGASMVLSAGAQDAVVQELSKTGGGKPITWVTLGQLMDEDVEESSVAEASPPSLAYLQYTSGSTAVPRGVMITHQNILAQCRSLLAVARVDGTSRSLCWLPYFHDYGLVHGLIAPFYAGIPAFLMSPLTFLRRPLRWLEAVGRWEITHSGAPNFAYDSCVKALRKQPEWVGSLHRWTAASCGAEPIHVETIERFCQAFAPHGFARRAFMPSYGLAEATLVVSSAPDEAGPVCLTVSAAALEANRVEPMDRPDSGGRALVGCGTPIPDMHVTIVHPVTLTECRSNEVGEIWVSGPSVGDGYWNRPDITKDTFNVALSGPVSRSYLRTGDLGFVNRGQLFITGRLKDLIILNGRNLYPHDLEAALEGCHPALRIGGAAVFSMEDQDGERLVVVQEIDRPQEVEVEEVATAIRVQLAARFEVAVWRVILVRAGAIPKTSSGKVQRQACRKAYVDQSLAVIASSVASEAGGSDDETASVLPTALAELPQGIPAITAHLLRLFAEQTRRPVDRIDPDVPLVNFALDSLTTSVLKHRLEQDFGLELSFAQLFGQGTLSDLARHLSDCQSSGDSCRIRAVEAWNEELRDMTANGETARPYLSASQARIWFLEQLHPGRALNHISFALRLTGPFDKQAFSASIECLVGRHDILRMGFASEGGQAYHRMSTDVLVPVRHHVLRGFPASAQDEEIRRWMREEAFVPFDVTKPPLLRVLILECGDDDHVCVFTVHRLIADGWSLKVFCRELSVLYNRPEHRRGSSSVPAWSNYLEYARWQRGWLDTRQREAQLSYWRQRLTSLPPPLDVPTDRPKPNIATFQGGARSRLLSAEMSQALGALCPRQGVTRFMVLYAAFAAWLQRCARTTDVVVGTVVANRRLARWEQVLGYFANTVALRMDLSDIGTVEELLVRARQVVSEAYDHQDVPFEQVLGALPDRRNAASTSIFNVMIVWEDDPLTDFTLHGLSATHLPCEDMAVEFDLTLLIVNGPHGLELMMLYDRALFDGPTVDRMLGQLSTLLQAMMADPRTRLADLPLLEDDEKRLVLFDWNATASEVPFTKGLLHHLETVIAQNPAGIAAICGEAELNYRDLQAQSDLVARQICRLTKGANVLIGLCVDRSTSSLVGLLGILKAGAAYVPLDPHAPEQRQRLVLEDAGVTLLVTQGRLRSLLPLGTYQVIDLESLEPMVQEKFVDTPLPESDLDHLAYAIYTSGSTGRPKGVEVTHRALFYSLAARLRYYSDPVDRCLLTFPLAFDGSITGVFWTLLHAGTLVIPSEDTYRDPEQLAALISRHRITHVVWVPSLYDAILRTVSPTRLRSLRVVVTAGESLLPDVVRRHHERIPDATLYNEYGPTEATVWSTVYRTNGTEQGLRIPIGRPIANVTVYLLDADMRPVPIGVVGEIVIGGATVARGYRNLSALSDATFVPNPYQPGTRMYRTGDLGRRRQDGNIEFIGRADRQVKLRGYRIELGEIEAVLRESPGIRDAVVVVQDVSSTGPALVAFVIAHQSSPSPGLYLQEWLTRRVPDYMVPAAVIVVDAFPVLSNGKVDRLALQQQVPAASRHESLPVRPRDPIEQSLIEIWSDILGQPAADVHQSFFALGGHSLLATQVVSRIRETFRIELPLRVLFQFPTIAGVAEHIRLEQRRVQSRPPLPPIVPVSRSLPLPLSYSQQRMWLVQQLAPESTAYNLLFVSRHKGSMKVSILRQVVDLLSRRHEAFRTVFAMTAAGLVQRVASWQAPHFSEVDLRRLPKEQREPAARRLAEEEGARPFDLEHGPLARIFLVTIDHDDHLLVLNLHHIIGDQWSFGILGRDFAGYYNALCQGQPLPEMVLPVQYADYAHWQRRCLTDETLKDQEAYWTTTLANLPILHLPTDFPRSATQTFRGAYCSMALPESVTDLLAQYGSRHQATSFMTMLACFQLLLGRYSGQTDVAVGSPIANRTQMAMEQLIGTFVNTLVLRADLSGDPSFDELVTRVKEAALGAFANQDFPFDRLVETLDVERDPSMAPLVQVLFNMVNAPIGDIQLYGLKWEPFEVDQGSAQFDLSLTVEVEFQKKIYLTFNTDLFTRATAERFLDHYVRLLEHALSTPTARLSQLTMLSPAERTRLLEEWNRTVSDYPRTHCLPELIEAQVDETPDAIAVSMEGDSLTYAALNVRANRMARALRDMGVAPNSVVGVCLDRSLDMVAALLAVLKAGGCYVPLDPDYPRDRLRFMVEDSGAALVLTQTTLSDRFTGQSCRVICLDRNEAMLARQDGHNLPPVAGPHDLAYMLYTSGSTGQPKGVEVRHRSLMNFLWSMKREPGCSSRDVLLSVTTFSFDIAGLELYLPLVVGGRVALASRAVTIDGRKLREYCEQVRPTLMQATPATWRLLLDAGWSGSPSLTVLCGGEALPPDLAKKLGERSQALWNLYGPTETTIWSTIERIDPSETSDITIGKPIANTEVYILDPHGQPVPVGVSGELYIGGDGLAKGYHNRPELTAERFVPHPFSARPDARLYRTGDVARYRADGKIVHVGRMDHQVKIRGFRIELDEIQAVLTRHPKVKQVVVTARDDQHGLKQLAAYVIPHEGTVCGGDELRSFLRGLLPEFMVPSSFVFLERFPLTANKKVDVRALPAPDFGSRTGARHVEPRNSMEVQLTAIWQQVLGIQRISVHDNFFELGGHSLKAAQLFYFLEVVFGKQLPLATLFQAPTVAELAAVLAQAQWTPPWQSLVAIQPGGSATPFFMVPGVGGNVLVFARLAKLLGTEQPMYGLQARGLDGKETPFTSVPDMAAHYVQAVRQVRPHGPYLIAGVCTGGLIAYEMAQQLIAAGETATVALLDTWHPDSYARHKHRALWHAFMGAIVLKKIWQDLGAVLRMPPKDWWTVVKRKSHVLGSLVAQSMVEQVQDQDFQVQRLTQATFLAVARYRVERLAGRVVNIIASKRQVDEMIPDTRHRWVQMANEASRSLSIPAEDSGRLFVSPYVEELAHHLRHHLQVDHMPDVQLGERNLSGGGA